MPTLNGEPYLSQQLDSIFNQRGCEVKLIVLDNGSTDGTLEILRKYQSKGFPLELLHSTTKGATKAFFALIEVAPTSDFNAFSDQDDIWLPQKLSSLVALCENEQPELAFSSRALINKAGELFDHNQTYSQDFTWNNAIIQNIVPGNCIVLNSAAMNLLKNFPQPAVAHYDSWIYLVMSIFGRIHYSPEELVQYRIHGNNAVGLRTNLDLFNTFTRVRNYLDQARELAQQKPSELNEVQQKNFSEFKSVVNQLTNGSRLSRFQSALKAPIYRRNKRETLIFKVALALFLLLNL